MGAVAGCATTGIVGGLVEQYIAFALIGLGDFQNLFCTVDNRSEIFLPVPNIICQFLRRFLHTFKAYGYDGRGGIFGVGIGESVEEGGVQKIAGFHIVGKILLDGNKRLFQSAACGGNDKHRQLHISIVRLFAGGENVVQTFRCKSAGFVHIRVGIFLDAEQTVSQFCHLRGDVAMELQRNGDGHIRANHIPKLLQHIGLQIVNALCTAGTVKHKANTVDLILAGHQILYNRIHQPLHTFFGEGRKRHAYLGGAYHFYAVGLAEIHNTAQETHAPGLVNGSLPAGDGDGLGDAIKICHGGSHRVTFLA